MAVSLHETCLEYFRRRLREGWKCIKLEGHNAVLLSPNGIVRPLDLRNDVETLRPDAVGTDGIQYQFPDSGDHYEKVDEATPDEDATYVWAIGSAAGSSWQRDLYNIPDSGVGSGTINKITVYARGRVTIGPKNTLKISIKSNSTTTDDVAQTVPTSYDDFSKEWATNPADSQAWERADINALQIGVSLEKSTSNGNTHCTQVYVEVDYTAASPPITSGGVSGNKETERGSIMTNQATPGRPGVLRNVAAPGGSILSNVATERSGISGGRN